MSLNDKYFNVSVLSKTLRPNLLAYLAMHQCVTEEPINEKHWLDFREEDLGNRVVNHCIKHGHYSVIEHPSITFLVQSYPHDVMVQLTRHRHLAFSVQSQRYTGDRILALANLIGRSSYGITDEIDKVFYVRPIGEYKDRKGNYCKWTDSDRIKALLNFRTPILEFADKVRQNVPYEMARHSLPQSIRQDFIVTMNARSLLHVCDLRCPKDAQLEISNLAYRFFEELKNWMPELANWYEKNRLSKNKLAP
jgi:thymidylate synthase (FAD)